MGLVPQNEEPVVRNVAVKCIGLCGLLDKDFALRHLLLLLQVSSCPRNSLVNLQDMSRQELRSIFSCLLVVDRASG